MSAMNDTPFDPRDIGFFLRDDKPLPFDIECYELDHPDIDKNIKKDWKRINVFMSRDNDFVTIWVGPVDVHFACHLYEEEYGFEISAEQNIENYFRGHIRTKSEGEVIWNAVRLKKYTPGYLGPDGWRLKHFKEEE